MDNFISLLRPVFFWLFILGVVVTVLLNASRVFIKDAAVEKKRNYWFYCSFFITAIILFILGLYGVGMPDHEIWKLVAELSGGFAIILGFFVFNFYKEFLPQPKPKRKAR